MSDAKVATGKTGAAADQTKDVKKRKRPDPAPPSPPSDQETEKPGKRPATKEKAYEFGDRRFRVDRPSGGILRPRNIAQCQFFGIPVTGMDDEKAYSQLCQKLEVVAPKIDGGSNLELRERYAVKCPIHWDDENEEDDDSHDYASLDVTEIRKRAMVPRIEGMISLRYTGAGHPDMAGKIVGRVSFWIGPTKKNSRSSSMAQLRLEGAVLYDVVGTKFSREAHVDVECKAGTLATLGSFAAWDAEVAQLAKERIGEFAARLGKYYDETPM